MPSQLNDLTDNGSGVSAAVHLNSSSDSETDTRVAKEGSVGARLDAQVKVEVGAVLVGTTKTVLGA